MNRVHRTTFILGLVLAAFSVFAQSPSGQGMSTAVPSRAPAPALPPDQQASKEQIEKMFQVMRMRNQMQQVLNMMPMVVQQQFQEQVKSMSAELPPGKHFTPQDQAALQTLMKKYMQRATEVFPVEAMVADAVPVYQRHVSRDDADAIIAFYNSPPGQRLLNEQPVIMSEYMATIMSNVQEYTKRLSDEMSADMQKVVKPETAAPGAPAPAQH